MCRFGEYTYMHTCIHASMHAYIHTYMHACMHTDAAVLPGSIDWYYVCIYIVLGFGVLKLATIQLYKFACVWLWWSCLLILFMMVVDFEVMNFDDLTFVIPIYLLNSSFWLYNFYMPYSHCHICNSIYCILFCFNQWLICLNRCMHALFLFRLLFRQTKIL